MDVNRTMMMNRSSVGIITFDAIAGHYDTHSNIILGVFPKRTIPATFVQIGFNETHHRYNRQNMVSHDNSTRVFSQI